MKKKQVNKQISQNKKKQNKMAQKVALPGSLLSALFLISKMPTKASLPRGRSERRVQEEKELQQTLKPPPFTVKSCLMCNICRERGLGNWGLEAALTNPHSNLSACFSLHNSLTLDMSSFSAWQTAKRAVFPFPVPAPFPSPPTMQSPSSTPLAHIPPH